MLKLQGLAIRSRSFGVMLGGAVGMMIASNLPIVLGVLARQASYDVQTLGLLASIELGGMCSGVVSASWYIVYVKPSSALRVLAFVHAVSYVAAAMFGSNFIALSASLFVVGITGGGLASVAIAEMGKSGQSDRALSLFNCVAMILAAAYAPILTWGGAKYGLAGLWYICAITALLVVPLSLLDKSPALLQKSSRPPIISFREVLTDRAKLSVVVGIFFCGLGIMMPWAFVERMGAHNDLDPTSVGAALGFGMIISIPPTVAYGFFADRFGLSISAILASLTLVGCTALFVFTGDRIIYTVAAGAFQLGWSVIWIACLSALSIIDRSGRLIVFGYFVFKASYVIAPMIGGAIAGYGGYSMITWATAAVVFVGCSLLIQAERRTRPALVPSLHKA